MAGLEREAPTLEQIRNELEDGRREHETRCRRYDRSYDIYRATPPKGMKRKPWEAKFRVQYGMQVIDTAMVNLVGGLPRAKVMPRREQDVPSAEAMQGALDLHIGADHLAEKQPVFVQQGLIYGATAAKNHWVFRDRTIRRREWIENPYGHPLPIESEERVVLRDGPTFEPWDIYDVWWEPNARDVDGAAYVAFRSWLSKDDLLKNVRSDDRPFGLFYPEAVQKLLQVGASGGDRSSAQERYLGGPRTKRKDRFEVTEVWRDETLTIVAEDFQVILCHKPNPYWFGRKPGVITQPRPDLFELVGIPETELIADLQDALNSLQCMRWDNLHLTAMRGFTYRDTGLINPAELELKPRFKWPVADHDDIRPVEIQPLPPESYREDEKLLAQLQLITGINPYVSGADLQTVDQNTATGVTALQEVASRLLKFKARQLALKGFLRTFEHWAEMVQQFMSDPIEVRTDLPDGGFDWKSVTPQEIVGNHDITIEGVEEALSRQTERAEAITLLNAFAPFAQVPGFNYRPVLERVAKAFDMPVGVLFTPPPPTPPAAPVAPGNGQPGQPGQPGQLVGGPGGPQLDPRIAMAIQSGGGTQ